MISGTYFKFRGRFEVNPHPYDIGWPIFTDRVFGLNFFVNKIYKIKKEEYATFYNYQLNHYLECHPLQLLIIQKHSIYYFYFRFVIHKRITV